MGGILQNGGAGAGGVKAATQAEHEQAATNGNSATEAKAATPRGLSWFWEKVKTLPQTFAAQITFALAPVISAFAGSGERIIVVDNFGRLLHSYGTADEFTATPPDFLSAGIPGQKAWQSPHLYYCVAPNFWIRFLAESSALTFADLLVAVPATLASPGLQGQFAYDPAAKLVYFCVATNTWIRYSAIPEEYLQMYVATPTSPTGAGKQGQRAFDVDTQYMYEWPADNKCVRWKVETVW